MSKRCILTNIFTFFFFDTYFGQDQTDLGPVLARFGPSWADSENEIKKN